MKLPIFGKNFWVLLVELQPLQTYNNQIKMRGLQKCKVHYCNYKGFKVTSLLSSASPGFEPGTPALASFPMLSGSRWGPEFKSQRSQTLKNGNFEALLDTEMYFTFLENSNLFLSGPNLSKQQLQFEQLKILSQYSQFLTVSLLWGYILSLITVLSFVCLIDSNVLLQLKFKAEGLVDYRVIPLYILCEF